MNSDAVLLRQVGRKRRELSGRQRETDVKYAEHNLQIKSYPSFIFFVNTGQKKKKKRIVQKRK